MGNVILHWLLSALFLILAGYVIPGFTITNFGSALLAAVVLGLLNVLVWPLLTLLTLPLTVITFGLFLFVVNAIVLKFGAALVPGFRIDGFSPAIIAAIFLALIGWLSRFVFHPAS